MSSPFGNRSTSCAFELLFSVVDEVDDDGGGGGGWAMGAVVVVVEVSIVDVD